MNMETNILHTWNMDKKRVLLRADLNVPLNEHEIIDDFRLRAVLPTIDLLIQKGAQICLVTHIDSPQGVVPFLSTHRLIPFFCKQGYSIAWADNARVACQLQKQKNPPQIILLENIRFTPYEKIEDKHFAQQLACLGDFFVQDAFGSLASTGASLTKTPLYFDIKKRSTGLLIDHEINLLDKFQANPPDKKVLLL